MPPLEVHVLDAQPAALHDAHPRAVHQPRHEGVRLARLQFLQGREQFSHFLAGQHDRQPARPFGPQRVDPIEGFFEHGPVEEEQRPEGLVLGAGRDVPVAGEVGEEPFDFGVSHVVGVPPGVANLVEDEVAFDPADVALFGVPGVVEEAEFGADLIHEFHGGTPTEGKRVRPRRAGVKALCRAARGMARVIRVTLNW